MSPPPGQLPDCKEVLMVNWPEYFESVSRETAEYARWRQHLYDDLVPFLRELDPNRWQICLHVIDGRQSRIGVLLVAVPPGLQSSDQQSP
jgi:hypothetical protein